MSNVEPLLYYKYNTRDLENIDFKYIDCQFEKVVIRNELEYEGFINAYYSLVRVGRCIRMYYRSGNIKEYEKRIMEVRDSKIRKTMSLCVAESNDGLNFSKPKLNVHTKNTNILMKGPFCHNFFVYFDSLKNKYVGLSGTKKDTDHLFLFESKNGYNWEQKNFIPEERMLPNWTHPNHWDSLNVLFYNPYESRYYCYLRHNSDKNPSRKVQLCYSRDLIKFKKCIPVYMSEYEDKNEVYIPGVMMYPGTSYFISFTSGLNVETFYKYGILMISRDGIKFDLIKENMYPGIKDSSLPVYGIIDLHGKYYVYVQNKLIDKNSEIICYSYIKDRIACLSTEGEGSFCSKSIVIRNHFYVNYECMDDGYIILELYDNQNNLIETSEKLVGNEMYKNVVFNKRGERIYIKFKLFKAKVYSYYF